MAKLCSPLGTSPISSFFNELTPNGFSDDFHQIQPDPFDLFEDLPSICSDIQKIESDSFSPYGGGMDLNLDMKPEVRNTDLMWWTAPPTTMLSTSASSMSSDISTGVSLATIMGVPSAIQTVDMPIKVEQDELHKPTVVIANNSNPVNFTNKVIVHIKQEPSDDAEQQLAYNSIPKPTTAQQPTMSQNTNTAMTSASMQNIAPGTSLLRKSQEKKSHITKRGEQTLSSANSINVKTSSVNFPSNTSSSFNTSKINSPNATLSYQRPDTPHSLDDDCSTPEFRHNVDLRACVMGSNNISLTSDQDFINNVTQELLDTSKKEIDTRLVSSCTLADVLEIINNSPNTQDFLNLKKSTSDLTLRTKCNSNLSYHSVNASCSIRSPESESDEESIMDSSSCSLFDHDITFNAGGVSPVSSQTSSAGSTQHYMQHRDHSYTRCKDGIDDISTNLETPSDSEEEIDVVSINDKKLPTNPTDKDRRALQTKVAHKFNTARIVKTPNGIRTIPPRRGCYEYPYSPASSSPVKSINNSCFPSPAVTPYQNQYTTKYVQQQQMMTVIVNDTTTGVPINIFGPSDKSRKRLLTNGGNTSNLLKNIDLSASLSPVVNIPPNKKHRGKKTKLFTAIQLPNGMLKRHCSDDEAADTIEKRNLHNDMERQRRIGLKNLFEALKKQIPSIKDKERAPKVNILREAAKLCKALTCEDQLLTEQKAKLEEQLRRKQELLVKLKAAKHTD